jgi:hypothetical protein
MSIRAEALASRVEEGAKQLAAFGDSCSETEWQTICPDEKRSVGVLVHHVANMYPIEVQLVQTLASGKPIAGVSWDDVAGINARHAEEHAKSGKEETLALLRSNSAAAVAAIRALSDVELDQAASISLNADAPLTTQYFIEEHPLGHPYSHLASIRAALGR